MAASQFLHAVHPEALSDKPFSQVPNNARVKQQLCEVRVPPHAIAELKRLIQTARLGPETFENSQPEPNAKYGLTSSWMKEAVRAWTDVSVFNWARVQDHINSVPHFTCEVEYEGHSYTVHYVALFSNRSDAVPLVNVHGWPGCFLEFLPLMNLLQQKYTPDTLPCHFIVPSMPGYTFSSGPPTERDFSTLDVSRIFQILLRQLGLDDTQYVVAGGDVGSRVARALVVEDPACSAIHLNFCFDLNMHGFPQENLNAQETGRLEMLDEFMKTGVGYGQMHATRPATIGFILSSNPVALLAWIGEKFATWTDKTPPLATILTFITVYWLTDTFPRSIYPYRADFASSDEVPSHGNPRWRIPDGKPFGFSDFPKEILPVPRAWVERTGRGASGGGHFAALEVPEMMLEDLEKFVGHVRAEGKIRAER
ncbi:hypothetical protein H2199_005409 [Coniosporium tulheliwenetii]|uniref:Uncharacterized protein n=1 Tax=Coniosporium tulheliwenetii TaxID=3383036 RepID=A0ACC2Z2G6_9PEZI|nr:hypothetical protein H2199_005409 [Cladosporium sp. JES 115]